MKYILTIGVLLIMLASHSGLADSETSAPPSTYQLSVHQIIVKQAQVFAAPVDQIYETVKHESGFDQNAIGDHGLAKNCAQYHEATFDEYEGKFYKATGQPLNYNSCYDQVTLMSWQFVNIPSSKSEWTTWRKMYGSQKSVHVEKAVV